MSETALNMGWAVIFSVLGGIVGIALVMASTAVLPRVIDQDSSPEQLQWYYRQKRAG